MLSQRANDTTLTTADVDVQVTLKEEVDGEGGDQEILEGVKTWPPATEIINKSLHRLKTMRFGLPFPPKYRLRTSINNGNTRC
jgi:hypothetical protein